MRIWYHTAASVAVVTLCLSVLGACTEDKPSNPGVGTPVCLGSADCADDPAGNLCLEGACAACGGDSQCAAEFGEGSICVEGRCRVAEETCDPGDLGCECASGDSCQGSAVCEGGVCVECTPGSQGCACAEGDLCLGELVCQEGACVPVVCPEGQEGCPCAEGDTCQGDSVTCSEGLCRACPNDMEGCPCVEGACGEELFCDSEGGACLAAVECANEDCGEHRLCGGDDGTICLDGCEEGFTFNEEDGTCFDPTPRCGPEETQGCADQHRACEDSSGEVLCGACLEGYLEEDGACRPVVDCEAAGCSGQFRACTEAQGQDAACGACLEGYLEEDGACRPLVDCEAAGCAGQSRGCTEAPGQDAVCAGCLEGFVEENGACRAVMTCQSLGCATLNRGCTEAVGTQDAVCGLCLGGYLEEDGACRALRTCESLGCAEQNRECTPATLSSDALCGGCAMGYLEEDGACTLDLRATCTDDPNDSNSILADCEARHRECMPAQEGATCGGCQEGYLENPDTEECLLLEEYPACEGAEAACPEGRYCINLRNGDDLRCLPAPCPEGQSWNLLTQACQDRCNCEIPEGEEDSSGLTGRPWPVTDRNGDCVCETREGFFFNASTGFRRVEPCDGDGDSWVRRSVFEFVQPEADPAVRQNARCTLREIDQFRLINEYGQSYDVDVSLISNGAVLSLVLYEPDEGDDELNHADSQEDPARGRRFRAQESNPLTRACVSANADLNHNAVSDLREHQRSVPGANSLAWMSLFTRMSYFVELHEGWFEPGEDGPGRYVIKERSRCEPGFPLHYNQQEGSWWQQCSRRRDGRYDLLQPSGYDFGEWSCIEARGACPVAPPPTDAMALGAVPPHGLCEERLGDGPQEWRGMNHASQFRCAEIISDEQQQDIEPVHVRAGELFGPLNPGGLQHANQCRVEDCLESGDPECMDSLRRGQGEVNTYSPVLTCDAQSDELVIDASTWIGRVTWVARRYDGYDNPADYAGGCIDESAEWPFLCPGYDPDTPERTDSQGATSNFGRLICGCGFNYGGFDCEVGCPDALLHVGGSRGDDEGFCYGGYCTTLLDEDGLDGGRSGFWMCGDFNASAPVQVPGQEPIMQGGGLEVRGFIPMQGTQGNILCENIDENGNCSGFTVH